MALLKHKQSLAEEIQGITSKHAHAKLLEEDVQNLTKVLGGVFDQCEGAYSTLEICRTESLQTMIKVSEKQFKPLHDALMKAKKKLNLDMDVDMYVESNCFANAGSFKLPNQTSEIILNSGLVNLLKLLDTKNENLALVVLLHELGHLMFRQSDIDTGMRIYSALLNDGSIAKSVLLQATTNVYRKYSVAMELTADRVMYSVMKDMKGGWDAIIRVFGLLAGGISAFPINCDELMKQYNLGDVAVGELLYTGVTSKDAHPPIMFRLQELYNFHCGYLYPVCDTDLDYNTGPQEPGFAAAARSKKLWDSL